MMRDIKDLCARIEDEISNIAEKGLTSGNLDTAFKLIDMYKDINFNSQPHKGADGKHLLHAYILA